MDTASAPVVLVIEDDPTIARLLATVLRRHGYHALIAPDADSAMQQLQTIQPALITLDLNLPGISGETLLGLIRAEPATAALPVIIVSACPAVAPAVHAQAQGVLCKPFHLAELIDAVRAAIGVPAPAPRVLALAG